MADELEQKPAATAPEGGVWRVPADRKCAVPAPASAKLTWHGKKQTLDYSATASHLDIRTDAGELIGQMFSLAYVALGSDGEPQKERPVSFCYNGGPGSSSVPINLGGIGPRRVKTDGTNHLPCPGVVEDNPYSLLGDSDLVFLDALGTGYSYLADGADSAKVWSVDGDADTFARAIAAWLTANKRWGSPVYLFGESYGTIRNAVLMRLMAEKGIQPTGVVMLSSIFDWVQTLPGEDLYYIGMVPTFAATASFFGKVGEKNPDKNFDAAYAFAEDEYAHALLKGDTLAPAEMKRVARKLSKLIGLPQEFIEKKHLRVTLEMFRNMVVADDGKICGRLDTRFCSDAMSVYRDAGFLIGEDAAGDATEGAWVAAFRAHLQDDLGYDSGAIYLSNNYSIVNAQWDRGHESPGVGGGKLPCGNVCHDIATAMQRNPTVKLGIIGGIYDAATTFWNVKHDMACQFLSPELKERVSWYRYRCGHMAYVDEPTLEQMGKDMHDFYAKQ